MSFAPTLARSTIFDPSTLVRQRTVRPPPLIGYFDFGAERTARRPAPRPSRGVPGGAVLAGSPDARTDATGSGRPGVGPERSGFDRPNRALPGPARRARRLGAERPGGEDTDGHRKLILRAVVRPFGMSAAARTAILARSPISFAYLKRFNVYAGLLHLVQGAAMLALGLKLAWSRPIYTYYLKLTVEGTSPPTFATAPNPQILFTLTNLGAILASFLLLSAVAHLVIAFARNRQYNENLARGTNPYRWYEYSVSSSIMIVLIALFLGVWDLWSLVMIFTLNALMIMFGYLMEQINQSSERTIWSPFVLGCVAGAVPWVVVFANFFALAGSSDLRPPAFVYVIVVLYFVLFNVFAVNMLFVYKGVGRWKDYLYGERFYIVLSLVAKSLLAWIVFSAILAP